ncbi:hypothetical protein O7635_23160 [Asanoa sp. WMMD1127]|uniref:hypothetical protein n=1 Tax=Asanoa sp. WMMD1127 TaxID=3016107 RepID=UPI002415C6A9|nr:hypothetical protein [Asanoa sp. WMMD1127]MDG4824760.1 hypothetical protein [Asanoa sp. WMMD1127]
MTSLRSGMDPVRQADIRQLLVTTASAPPVSAWQRNRRAGLATVAAAAVVVAGSVVLADAQDPPPSYAGWTAVPQAAPPPESSSDDIEEWASQCTDLGVGGVAIEGVPARRAEADRRQVLVDRRGDLTYCVDVSLGRGTARDPLIALSGIKARGGLSAAAATVYDKPFTRPGAADVLVLGASLANPPREPGVDSLEVFQLYGLSGPDVTGVDLVLANGLRVTASLRGGIWGVWWPSDRGEPDGCVLEVRTSGGTATIDPDTVRLHFG